MIQTRDAPGLTTVLASVPDDGPAVLCLLQVQFWLMGRDAERSAPCTHAGLIHASRWFARYEAAVGDRVGVGHRVPRDDAQPPRHAVVRACSLERAWSELADE